MERVIMLSVCMSICLSKISFNISEVIYYMYSLCLLFSIVVCLSVK